MKQEVKYVASKTNQYINRSVMKATEPLMVQKSFISKENINNLFNFTLHKEVDNLGGGQLQK